MKRLSIKIRVTLWYTLLMAVIAMVALLVLFTGAQRMIINYYQGTLRSTAQLAQDDITYEHDRLEIDRNLDDLPNVRVAIYTLDGELIYGRHEFDLPFEAGMFREALGRTGTRWYVLDTPMNFDDNAHIWLRLFISMDTTANLTLLGGELLAVILPVLVLLAAIGGYLITRRAFRPVAQIACTAESIADGSDLKKRIALDGAHDEIHRLSRVFDDMLERLQQSFEREQRFTADASHELRTPVTAILAQSDYALSESAGPQDKDAALQDIHQRAAQMSGLIGRLLTLTRMDAGQTPLAPEDMDLNMLLEIVAQQLEPEAEARAMRIVIEDNPEITGCCDQTMMTQAVLNLVGNAIRYGRQGGCIRLAALTEPGGWKISVTDDGPGIASEDLPHIFDRFYQADRSRRREGAGLGLALVKQIAELHGGHVTVESTPGVGSCFTIHIPQTGVEA